MRTKLSGKKVVIFGGSGFIGSHLVKHLCKESCQVVIVSRKPRKSPQLFFANNPGQVEINKIDNFDQNTIDAQTKESDVIFNLIGILAESKKAKFDFIHTKIPEMIAKSAKKK